MLQKVNSGDRIKASQAKNVSIQHIVQAECQALPTSTLCKIRGKTKRIGVVITAHYATVGYPFSHQHWQKAKTTPDIQKASPDRKLEDTPVDRCKSSNIGILHRSWSEGASNLISQLDERIEAEMAP